MVSLLLVLVLAIAAAPLAPRFGRLGGAALAVAPAYGFAWVCGWLAAASPRTEAVFRVPWVPNVGVDFALRLDGLSAFFALLILGIGALVLTYAGSYLHGHRDLGRFYVTLLAFMASMLGLVLADDAILMFVFWEGTSLSSYLLIGFDHDDRSARVAARKALVVTGTGGLALLGGILLMHHATGTFSLAAWTSDPGPLLSHPLAGWALALVLVGAFTKSAQVPFHFWLPAAMAGPTPVSAYLHSATMVKAGVFLLARLSPVWSGAEAWTPILVSFGAATMLLSAWAALRYRDLKTILAYTTTMALGLLVMLLGFGDEASVTAAMAYLLVHALYKGSLFMMAGTVDHGAHTRDLDKLSGLRTTMPWTAAAAGLAAASMAGLPPFLGFVGKELAYEANLHLGGFGLVALGIALLANAALFGVAAVLAVKPFFGRPSPAAEHAHEGDLALLAGPVTLAALGLGLGLFPGLLDELLGAAASAVRGAEVHAHFALWHGIGPALGASLATYGLGFAVLRVAPRLRSARSFGFWVAAYADVPARGFERGLLGLGAGAAALTRTIYRGRLRQYVLATFILMFGGVWFVFLRTGQGAMPEFGTLLPHELMLVLVLVGSSGLAAVLQPAMRAIIAVGISGFCVALLYLLFGAPDVAMTQFAIETLTVILVVLTLLHLPSTAFARAKPRTMARDIAVALLAGAALSAVLLGVLSGTLPSEVSDWYLAHSAPDAHGHNVVNVILVDFRGFDTWGEITVLTIAGLGVYALLRRPAKWEGYPGEEGLD